MEDLTDDDKTAFAKLKILQDWRVYYENKYEKTKREIYRLKIAEIEDKIFSFCTLGR